MPARFSVPVPQDYRICSKSGAPFCRAAPSYNSTSLHDHNVLMHSGGMNDLTQLTPA